MAHYYHLDSTGEHTNLQLYCLKQAKKYWEELQSECAEYAEETQALRERCVFVLATLGLSISQLLGQNNPALQNEVPYPIDIFNQFVDAHGLDPNLKVRFRRFNYFYNGCRHFGRTTGTHGYDRVDQLSYPVARECYEFGLEVWQTVVRVFRKEPGADLEELNLSDLDIDY